MQDTLFSNACLRELFVYKTPEESLIASHFTMDVYMQQFSRFALCSFSTYFLASHAFLGDANK